MADHDAKPQDDKDESEKPSIGISVGGNVSGKIIAAQRDIHITEGDEIKVGNITNSTGVGIGSDVSVNVRQNSSTSITINQVFEGIQKQLDDLAGHNEAVKPETVEEAHGEVEDLKQEALKGEKADEGFLRRRFCNLARMGPDILDVVTAALVNPAAGVAMTVKKIAEKARMDSGLESVS